MNDCTERQVAASDDGLVGEGQECMTRWTA